MGCVYRQEFSLHRCTVSTLSVEAGYTHHIKKVCCGKGKKCRKKGGGGGGEREIEQGKERESERLKPHGDQ